MLEEIGFKKYYNISHIFNMRKNYDINALLTLYIEDDILTLSLKIDNLETTNLIKIDDNVNELILEAILLKISPENMAKMIKR